MSQFSIFGLAGRSGSCRVVVIRGERKIHVKYRAEWCLWPRGFGSFNLRNWLRWPRGRLLAECDEKDEHGTEVDEEESRQVKELNGVCTVFNFCLWKTSCWSCGSMMHIERRVSADANYLWLRRLPILEVEGLQWLRADCRVRRMSTGPRLDEEWHQVRSWMFCTVNFFLLQGSCFVDEPHWATFICTC